MVSRIHAAGRSGLRVGWCLLVAAGLTGGCTSNPDPHPRLPGAQYEIVLRETGQVIGSASWAFDAGTHKVLNRVWEFEEADLATFSARLGPAEVNEIRGYASKGSGSDILTVDVGENGVQIDWPERFDPFAFFGALALRGARIDNNSVYIPTGEGDVAIPAKSAKGGYRMGPLFTGMGDRFAMCNFVGDTVLVDVGRRVILECQQDGDDKTFYRLKSKTGGPLDRESSLTAPATLGRAARQGPLPPGAAHEFTNGAFDLQEAYLAALNASEGFRRFHQEHSEVAFEETSGPTNYTRISYAGSLVTTSFDYGMWVISSGGQGYELTVRREGASVAGGPVRVTYRVVSEGSRSAPSTHAWSPMASLPATLVDLERAIERANARLSGAHVGRFSVHNVASQADGGPRYKYWFPLDKTCEDCSASAGILIVDDASGGFANALISDKAVLSVESSNA